MRPKAKRLVVGGSLAILLSALLGTPVGAGHNTFHRYTYGGELGAGSQTFIGAYNEHTYEGYAFQNTTGCTSTPYTGHPKYKTMWLYYSDVYANDYGGWFEFGTGACSNTYKYNFFGYGYGYDYYHVYSSPVSGTAFHSFTLERGVANPFRWEAHLDFSLYAYLNWAPGGQPDLANYVLAGLESYDSSADTAQTYRGMNWKWNGAGGVWYGWSNMEANHVDTTMCGHYVTQTDRTIGENRPSC